MADRSGVRSTRRALTVLDGRLDGAPCGLRCVDGTITALGPEVTAEPGDEMIQADGLALVEPLVNGHTHAAMTLLRGYGDDLPLMTWLQSRIWPAEARLEPEDAYWGTRLACLEMIRSGTTSFWDMYWHTGAIGRAVEDSGVRAVVCAPLFDGGDASRLPAVMDEVDATVDSLAPFSDRVRMGLGPHAVYTVSEPSLRWIGSTLHERGLPVHIHVAETRGEVDDCVTANGIRPLELLDRCGLVGPTSALAHGCWLEPSELALVAEREATIVTNPVSNMKLAVGRMFPYLEAAAAGVAIGLGTDGAASNNSLDLLQDVKILALAQKFVADDAATLPAHEAWAIATGQRSPLLGGKPLAVGRPADFLLVRTDLPEMAAGDLTANLIYAATGSVVDATVVDGRVLMRDRFVPGAEEVVIQARERAERLTSGG